MVKRQITLPQRIEPFRLAEAGRSLQGRLPLHRMQRLAPSLASADGEVEVELNFGKDADGNHTVVGHLYTELQLICQRCLESMPFAVDTDITLTFVAHESEAEKLPEHIEPYVAETEPLFVADLVEDELLLCLPQVALHPLQACPAREALASIEASIDTEPEADRQKDNPFAVLSKLKTQEPD